MTSAINEIDMEFEEIKNVNIETIGSLSQITRPCPIKYKSMKVQHSQVQHDRRQTLTEFMVKDNIYIGGNGKVLILNTDGSRVREITTDGGYNNNLLYNERNDQLLLRQDCERLCCINLDGHVIYRYDISGFLGLAVDQQGHVYISGSDSDDIHTGCHQMEHSVI